MYATTPCYPSILAYNYCRMQYLYYSLNISATTREIHASWRGIGD